MPQEVRKPSILRKLTKKLGIQPGVVAAKQFLSDVIVPVTDIDAVVEAAVPDSSTQDISSSSTLTYWTVPANERWRLIALWRPTTAGDCGWKLVKGAEVLAMESMGTTFQVYKFGRDWILDTGDAIKMRGGNNGADSAVKLQILYLKEEIT